HVLIAHERRATPIRRAQSPGPEGVWPKRPDSCVARLDRSPGYGTAPGALETDLLGHKREPCGLIRGSIIPARDRRLADRRVPLRLAARRGRSSAPRGGPLPARGMPSTVPVRISVVVSAPAGGAARASASAGRMV